MKIENKLFLVTGGASGLGRDTVLSLTRMNAVCAIIDVNEALALELVKEVGEDKVYFPGPTDVTSEEQVDKAISKSLERFSDYTLGGTVISHGIATTPGTLKGYGPDNILTSYKQFELVVKVNLLGTYVVAQKVAELLLKNEPFDKDGERGIILTVSSAAGLDGALTAYGTSKAGVAGLTLPLARELSSFGIRVMSIAPGIFDTPMTSPSNLKASSTKIQADHQTNLFPHRYGNPNEFADFAVNVIQTPLLNGSVIRLDGALRI